MVKLVAIYSKPDDVDAFDKHYFDVHVPLAKAMPGLKKVEVSRYTGSPAGDPRYYLMAELYFENKDAMFAGLNSPEGKAAAKDVMGFAGKYVHMMFADVLDD